MKFISIILILVYLMTVPVLAQEQLFELSIEKEDMPYIQQYHRHYIGYEIHKSITDHPIDDVCLIHFKNNNNGKVEIEEWKKDKKFVR